MPDVIKTPDDYGYAVEFAEIGEAGPNGTRPLLASRLAEREAALQDANGKPLTGKALRNAFDAWATGRNLELANVKDSALPPPSAPDIRDMIEPDVQRDQALLAPTPQEPVAAGVPDPTDPAAGGAAIINEKE